MQKRKFFAKALGVAITLPVSGLIILGGAAAANALTCHAGYVPAIAGNGAEVCSPRNDGGVSGGGTAATGNGSSTSPGQAAPVVGDTAGVPALPPVATPAEPSVPPVQAGLPPGFVTAIPPVIASEGPDASSESKKESSDHSRTTKQSPVETDQPDAAAPSKATEIKVDVFPSPLPTIMVMPPQTAVAVPSPQPTGSVTPSISPDKSSSSTPFNPSGIYVGVLSGLLVVLAAALVTVLKSNKKLARK